MTNYKTDLTQLKNEEMILNMGPQHPSMHGVLRLELLTDGELVKECTPHIGYLHRCFEKHAENLTYQQIIPFVDRMDYLTSMNNDHIFVMGVEKMMGIDQAIPKRTEYIRVLVSELNRIASHLIAIGTYGMDICAVTPFFWCFRDREHILNLLEWASGARLLYNYIWVGGNFYDLPIGFEDRCSEFVEYFKPKMRDLDDLLTNNQIFINRTKNVGVLPLDVAVNYGCSGPMLRASGLKWDLRRVDEYSIYPELEFNVPMGEGLMGTVGDCWDRYYVRVQEVYESLHIIEQCLERLKGPLKRSADYDPRSNMPKKIIPKAQEFYIRGESPKGELGYFFVTDGKTERPIRCKARSGSFSNLSVLPEITKGAMIADIVAILGSIDIVLGEVDR
jgi:NADH-quinone oxidoreductase subunit D